MSVDKLEQHMLPAFATPIVNYHWSDSDSLNTDLAAHVRLLEQSSEGITKSNVGGWHSGLDFLDADVACIAELRSRLNELITALGERVLRPELRREAANFRLEGWANVLRSGQYNTVHNHPNAFWSGAYYVTGNEALATHPFSGKLELLDPRPGASLAYSEKTGLYGRFLLSPVAGQVIVFPSWLQHQVHPYFGEAERISIAFNVMV
jgi:uncharacterized protein (TIGR02466 family)